MWLPRSVLWLIDETRDGLWNAALVTVYKKYVVLMSSRRAKRLLRLTMWRRAILGSACVYAAKRNTEIAPR
jgi:hypothetical protein